MFGDELHNDVVLAVQRILEIESHGSTDPLDDLSSNFNPAKVLNDLFPDESSLAQTEEVNNRLNDTQAQLRREIQALHAELQRSQDPERMQLIQEMISDLLGQMSRIREKATESEAVVRNITKDIQILDTAKKNLILSMTVLRRLQMLINGLTQLEELVKEKQYAEVAQTLSAIRELSESFQPYKAVSRISQCRRRIIEIQGELKARLDEDFDAFYLQDPSKQVKPTLIAEACKVVDVLGDDFRLHLIDRYVAMELKDYRRVFRPTEEAGQLDNISRRFAWFKRLLQTHELEQGRVFPGEWRVGWYLLARFTEITREDITALLAKAGSNLTVKSLLDNLQLTVEFESTMAKKWATSTIMSTVAVNHSYVSKPMSSAFESHMGIFVDAQERALSDMLAPHRKGRFSRTLSTKSPHIVLPSSTELFYFYRQSLDQCAKYSTGQALYDLCTLHKKWLKIYAGAFYQSLFLMPPSAPRRSTDSRFDPQELKHSCIVINTADYCQTTAVDLEEKIRQEIDEGFKEKITLQTERDLFVSVISSAIVVQLRELELACESAFSTMSRTAWNTLNQVVGQSPYTHEVIKAAEQVADTIKPHVEQKKYLRNFFDKACSLILAKFTNALVKSRPLKEIGAEQLLIDLQAIKAFLIKLPGDLQTATTGRLEALLKVIVTPVDPPQGFILNYTLLINDASFTNFQKILDLKGTPKAAQNGLLDTTKTDLQSTSFLSSLDMDPPMHPGASLVSPGASRVSLPLVIGASISGDGISGGVEGGRPTDQRREVFSDFKRFVSFGLRKETVGP
ncbi:Vps53-like protein [Amanita rubescens]|nr:Vps53-like protein [Amanita rubescens]